MCKIRNLVSIQAFSSPGPCPRGFVSTDINGTCNLFNPCPSGAVCMKGVCCGYQISGATSSSTNEISFVCPNNTNANGICLTDENCKENFLCLNGICCFRPNSILLNTSVGVQFDIQLINSTNAKCPSNFLSLNLQYLCNISKPCPDEFQCFDGQCCGKIGNHF